MISGYRLKNLASEVFTPFDQHLVSGTSVDVTLGSKFWVQNSSFVNEPIDLSCIPSEDELYTLMTYDTFELKPKQFVKAQTAEKFTMPNNAVGMFSLRSAIAQAGLEQSTSVWVRPSWAGHLILELTNLTERTLLLREGLRIGQVHFFDAEG